MVITVLWVALLATLVAAGMLAALLLRGRTSQRAAELAAADAIERRYNVLEAVADGMYIVDERLRITHVNEEAERLLSSSGAVLVGASLDRIVDPLGSELVPDIRLARRDGTIVEQTYHFAGSQRSVEVRIKPAAIETLVYLRDVTARTRADSRLRENEQRLQLVTDNVDAVLWTAGRDARFSAVSGGALGDLGLDADALLDEPVEALLARRYLDEAFAGKQVRAESALGDRWLRHHVEPLSDRASGSVSGAVGVSIDITELKRAEQVLLEDAQHDRLTGLPNRRSMERSLVDAISGAKTKRGRFAVLFVDLDRFKAINDTLGHDFGDEVLRAVSARLKEAVRTGDIVSRMGGDEFVILLPHVATDGAISVVTQRIARLMQRPIEVGGSEAFVSASVGVAIYPDHGTEAAGLLSHADLAMYRAKRLGGNGHVVFDGSMERQASERRGLENDLHHALRRGELHVLYQPIVQVSTRRVVGCEALVRWNHPSRGALLPDAFIPIAEETGMIVTLDRWVLAEACGVAAEMRKTDPAFRIAVNCSARDLREPDLPDVVASVLAGCNLAADALTLEITEHIALDDKVLPVLERIAAHGVKIAIDDFGIGYSSLSYLKRLPITGLKIDRSFIESLADDKHDQAIVRAIVAVAKALDLHVTAEGLENEAQVDFVQSLGCHEGQGYCFAVPLSLDDLRTRVASEPVAS